jgi:hypothetical protein
VKLDLNEKALALAADDGRDADRAAIRAHIEGIFGQGKR